MPDPGISDIGSWRDDLRNHSCVRGRHLRLIDPCHPSIDAQAGSGFFDKGVDDAVKGLQIHA